MTGPSQDLDVTVINLMRRWHHMAKPLPDPFTAFAEAGSTCFIKPCGADALYVVMSDDYAYPACGRHLTTAVDAIRRMEYPQLLQMTVFLKP